MFVSGNTNEEIKLVEPSKMEKSKTFVFKFENLKNRQEYKYRCGSEFSEISSLKFPYNENDVKVLIFSDKPSKEEANKTMNFFRDKKRNFDAILSMGKMGYENVEKEGEEFMEIMKPLFSNIPLMNTLDGYDDPLLDEWMNKKFNLPNKEKSNSLFYSFDVRNAHFISVPSNYLINQVLEQNTDNLKTASDWLKEDLSNTKMKWKILYTSKPLYCSDPENEVCQNTQELRSTLEKIIDEYKVNIVITGGISGFQVLFPVMNLQAYKEAIENKENSISHPNFPVFEVCSSLKNSKENKYRDDESGISETICELRITDDDIVSSYISLDKSKILDTFSYKTLSETSSKKENYSIEKELKSNEDTEQTDADEDENGFGNVVFYFTVSVLCLILIYLVYYLLYSRSESYNYSKISKDRRNTSDDEEEINGVKDYTVIELKTPQPKPNIY